MKLIQIRYNAGRFPRVIILRNHKKQVFQPDKQELYFTEYDANLLLKNNSRIKSDIWEFSVVGVEEITASLPEKEVLEDSGEDVQNIPSEDKVKTDKKPLKRGRPKK